MNQDPENHEDAGICMPLMKSLLKADQLDKGIYDEDPGICVDCGYPLTPVRPGKAQCDYCELLAVHDQETYDHLQTRKALDALIAENDRLQATIAQLQDRLDGEMAEWKSCAQSLYSAAELALEYCPSCYAKDVDEAIKNFDAVKKFYSK